MGLLDGSDVVLTRVLKRCIRRLTCVHVCLTQGSSMSHHHSDPGQHGAHSCEALSLATANHLCSFFCSFLVLLVGACQIVMGSILQHALGLGTGRYAQPIVAGWLVSYHAWTNLLVGVFLTIWGGWGITKAVGFKMRGDPSPPWGFVAMGLVAFLLEISVHDISNVGLGSEPLQVIGSQLVGVMFCLCFLPMYASVALYKHEEWESQSIEGPENKDHSIALVSNPV